MNIASQNTSPTMTTIGAVTLQAIPYIYLIDQNGNLLACSAVANGQQQAAWITQGIPEGRPLQGPAGLTTDQAQQNAYVFVIDETGAVWCNQSAGGMGTWTNLGAPATSAGTVTLTGIGAGYLGTDAFVVCKGDDDNVWLTSSGMKPGTWVSPGPLANGVTIQATLGVALSGNALQVCALGSDTTLQVCNIAADGSSSWQTTPAPTQCVITTPVGVVSLAGNLYAYGLDVSGNLQCIYFNAGWVAANLGQTPTGPCATPIGATIDAAGNPAAYVTDPTGVAYANSGQGGAGTWSTLGTPNTTSIVEAPVGVTSNTSTDFAYIFDQYNEIWGYASNLATTWVAMD